MRICGTAGSIEHVGDKRCVILNGGTATCGERCFQAVAGIGDQILPTPSPDLDKDLGSSVDERVGLAESIGME